MVVGAVQGEGDNMFLDRMDGLDGWMDRMDG